MFPWLPVFQGGCNVSMVTCVSGRGVCAAVDGHGTPPAGPSSFSPSSSASLSAVYGKGMV